MSLFSGQSTPASSGLERKSQPQYVTSRTFIYASDKRKAEYELTLLTLDERARACKFYFIRDAKLSVASSLLKRLFVATQLGVDWKDVSFARRGDSKHGKPCYLQRFGDVTPIDFNVSHQAGLAALVGCATPGVEVGIDITCVNERERSDVQLINEEGFERWVDIHEEVFSAADLRNIKSVSHAVKQQLPALGLPTRIRRFYTFWCLKEAYIKLVGEGLLANWLKDVEFRNVTCPEPHTSPSAEMATGWGERILGIEVWVRGQKQNDVSITLQAFEENYIFGTAVRQSVSTQGMNVECKMLNLETDVYPFTGVGKRDY